MGTDRCPRAWDRLRETNHLARIAERGRHRHDASDACCPRATHDAVEVVCESGEVQVSVAVRQVESGHPQRTTDPGGISDGSSTTRTRSTPSTVVEPARTMPWLVMPRSFRGARLATM